MSLEPAVAAYRREARLRLNGNVRSGMKTTGIAILVAFIGLTMGCKRSDAQFEIPLTKLVKQTDTAGVMAYDMQKIRKLQYSFGDRFFGWDWVPKPDGFSLSPGDADFIFSSVLHNGGHFGTSASGHMYYDTNSYYVADIWPGTNAFDSAVPMLRGATRINAADGTVFDRVSGLWQRVGFLSVRYPAVVEKVSVGWTREKVVAELGKPFEEQHTPKGTKVFDLDLTPAREVVTDTDRASLEYWCHEGNFLVIVQDGIVTGVVTNVPWGRL